MLKRTSPIRLLEVDADLGEGLAADRFDTAVRDLVVAGAVVRRGEWDPRRELAEEERHVGLLVVDGLLLRRIAVAATTCAELVGNGDVLRPWEHFGAQAAMPYEVSWQVLEPTRVAVLDRQATELICRYPEVTKQVIARCVARAHALAFALAVTSITGINIRLLALLWHLADRWGKVTPVGVHVPLGLTHETLGQLVGARRPSVSTALGELERSGTIEAQSDGWRLYGDPPEEVRKMHDRRRMTGVSS